MKTILLAMLAATVALSGCITTPNEVPAAQPVDEAGLGLGSQPSPMADQNWWNVYGDPQLDRLMQQGLADNPTLAQALARVREAQSIADVTRSGLAPSVSIDARETRQRFSAEDIIPPPYSGGVHWEGSEGFNLSWDLDFWGRQSELLKQASSQVEAAGLDAAGARLALAGAMLRAYVNLDRQYALADIAQRSEQQREEILAITRRRVHSGLDTDIELREADSAVPQAQVELSQAQAEQARAVHLLAALSGSGAEAYAGIARPQLNESTELELPDTLPADLLGRRPDVLAARSRVEGATAGKAAAKAAFYPDINLVAFVGTSAIGFGNLFRAASGSYGAGPAIHLPLFDAGRLKAEYRGAGAEIDASVTGYDATVLQAVREVSDQLSDIAALRDQLVKQQQSLDAAEAAYRLARERYAAGLASYLTVLNAETEVLGARRQRVELVAAQATARISLLLAVGGSFEPPNQNGKPQPIAVAAPDEMTAVQQGVSP